MMTKRVMIAMTSAMLLAAASPVPPPITGLRTISLHSGVNHVPGFLLDGGTATIVQAWRENGNAHGYFVWMVLAGGKPGQPTDLVEFDGRGNGGEIISASPFDGERVTADVRFATGSVGGKPVSLAIEGVLDEAPNGVIADHATATIKWYKLIHRVDEIGGTPDAFEPIGSVRTTKRYCNVDLALRDTAHVTLPRDFAGPNRIDGCFPNGG